MPLYFCPFVYFRNSNLPTENRDNWKHFSLIMNFGKTIENNFSPRFWGFVYETRNDSLNWSGRLCKYQKTLCNKTDGRNFVNLFEAKSTNKQTNEDFNASISLNVRQQASEVPLFIKKTLIEALVKRDPENSQINFHWRFNEHSNKKVFER